MEIDNKELTNSKKVNQYILTSTGHRITSFQQRLKELRLRDFPGSSPKLLLDILLKISNSLFEKLNTIELELSNSSNSYEVEDRHMQLLLLNNTVAKLSKYLNIVNNAESKLNVWSFVNSLQLLAEKIARQTKVIIHPQWSYNYSYIELVEPLKNLVPTISKEAERNIFRGFSPYFIVLTFPSIEKEYTLHNAAIAHELGHFIDNVEKITEYTISNPIIDGDLVNQVVEKVKRLEVEQSGAGIYPSEQTVKTRVYSKAAKIVKGWIQELTADILSVCLIGPAAIFAFDEVVLRYQPFDKVEYSLDNYPPPRIRLKVMLQQLELMGINEILDQQLRAGFEKEVVENVIVRLQELSDLTISPIDYSEDLFAGLGINAIDRGILHIRTKLDTLTKKPWFFSPKEIIDAICLVELLRHNLPPSELPTSSGEKRIPELGAIINAGWFFTITYQQHLTYFKGEKQSDIFNQYLRTNNLVNKAIEVSQITKEYNRRRGRIEHE